MFKAFLDALLVGTTIVVGIWRALVLAVGVEKWAMNCPSVQMWPTGVKKVALNDRLLLVDKGDKKHPTRWNSVQ